MERRDLPRSSVSCYRWAINHPFGSPLSLTRYPVRPREALLAWDAADALLLAHLAETFGEAKLSKKRILIVGDSFGALSTSLAVFHPTTYTDSFVSLRATEKNRGSTSPEILFDLEKIEGTFDLVLLRPPKNLTFLEDILARASTHLAPGALLVAGVMVKYQSTGAFELIGKHFGETTTSLAQKKARLIHATFTRPPSVSRFPTSVAMPGFDKPFSHPSNLFSREKLDIGTRFLLEHLPKGDFQSILDLGCANGILGIAANRLHPKAHLTYTDDSWMAIEAARVNHAAHIGTKAEFVWTNAYDDGPAKTHDLVLCNPPFHQGTTVGDTIAEAMFRNAHRTLKPGGLLRVIGNTPLDYPKSLRRIFGNAKSVARNAKFTIVDATR